MADPVVIGYSQNKFIKEANTKLITLRSSAGTAAPVSFKNGGTDYTPAVGKKFIILNFAGGSYGHATAGQETIFNVKLHTTPNAAGGTTYLEMPSGTYQGHFNIDVYVEVTSGNYINLNNTSFGIAKGIITGVETDV